MASACGDSDSPNTQPAETTPSETSPDAGQDAPTDTVEDTLEDTFPKPDEADPFFAPDHVLDIAITIDSQDWDELRNQSRTLADILAGDCLDGPRDDIFSWFSADIAVDGTTYANVGIRKKGFLGSLSSTKPSLKVRFDKYEDGQLLGDTLERLTLNNVRQDPSKLNTCMSYYAFAQAGIPTPRCNFARVSINGDDFGLFVHVESIKPQFLERNFGESDGNLYEGTISDFRPKWRGSFEKKTNEDASDWSDVEGLTEVLQQDPVDLDALRTHIDLDAFLTFWAMETIVGHWDGYSNNRNNYYIYHSKDDLIRFIPWGPDSAFVDRVGGEENGGPISVRANGILAHRLYANAEVRALYVARLRELLDTVWDEERLEDEVDRMAAIVQTHALEELREYAQSDTPRLKEFIRERRQALLDEIGTEAAEWTAPLEDAVICWRVRGAVDIAFETTWDSREVEEPFQEGSAVVTEYRVDGEALSYSAMGVTAGLDIQEGRPAEQSPALISILGYHWTRTIDILGLYLPPSFLAEGEIPFDEFVTTGFWFRLPPPYAEASDIARIASGSIVFEQAGTEPGDPIVGRVVGVVYGVGGEEVEEPETPNPEIGLILNELSAKGEPNDWIEVYNASPDPIDLSTFTIADDLNNIDKRVAFPAETIVEPGAYLQIFLDKDAWPGFALGDYEAVGIWTEDGVLVDRADWLQGQAPQGKSFGRSPDRTGGFVTLDTPTPGEANP